MFLQNYQKPSILGGFGEASEALFDVEVIVFFELGVKYRGVFIAWRKAKV